MNWTDTVARHQGTARRYDPLDKRVDSGVTGVYNSFYAGCGLHAARGDLRLSFTQRAVQTACRQVGIFGIVINDLRHMFVTNIRRAGGDYFRILAIIGCRAIDMLKRFHATDQHALDQAVSRLKTDMDTTPVAPTETIHHSLKD